MPTETETCLILECCNDDPMAYSIELDGDYELALAPTFMGVQNEDGAVAGEAIPPEGLTADSWRAYTIIGTDPEQIINQTGATFDFGFQLLPTGSASIFKVQITFFIGALESARSIVYTFNSES